MKTSTIIILILLTAALSSADNDGLELEVRGPGLIQGEPVLFALRTEKPAVWATAEWLGQKVSFEPAGDILIGMAAVDRNCKPAEYPLKITVQFADGSEETFQRTLAVAAKTFPVQELSVDPRYVKLSKEDLAWVAADNQAAAKAYASSGKSRMWNQPFMQPAEARWSADFGLRRLFNGEERSYHSGADLAVPPGTPVKCSNDGRVALVRHMFFGGNTVLVDHGQGVFTGYMHLIKAMVKEGELVERGQTIGLSGSTGRVTGPHLHWMLRVNGVRCNARGLLSIAID